MHFRSQKKSAQDVSLSDYIETGADGAPLALMDVVSDQEDLTENYAKQEDLRLLCRAVDTVLTDLERQVIVARYGLGGKTPLRQRQVAQLTGISRSAFYKYRDAVLPFQNMMIGRIITFQLLLQDETGILSTLLNLFAEVNANITTINSIVPTNGCAVVTISAETMDLTVHIEELLRLIRKTPGVIKAEVLAG